MWMSVARGKQAVLVVGLSLVAIAAAPLVMGPTYVALQPKLGAMTLFAVEVLYALFIDFPLATLYVAVLSLWVGRPSNPVRAALVFVVTFFAMILLVIAAAPLSELLAYWALADTFPQAMLAARQGLGEATTMLLLVQFVMFDLILCAAGGMVGAQLVERGAPALGRSV